MDMTLAGLNITWGDDDEAIPEQANEDEPAAEE
jgi:hypothetical protein